MSYKVLNTMRIGKDTVVTLEGGCFGLRNNMVVMDESEKDYNLISIALQSGLETILDKTTVLIEGVFDSKEIILK